MRWLIAIALAGCSGPTVDGTTCGGEADCNLFNVQGTCEPTGFCSYPDSTCADGRRYAPGAGDGLGGTCLGGDLACGQFDQACCGVDTCGPDLACTAGRCSCGAAGEPCCGGATCGTGLACGDGACSSAAVDQVAVGAGHVCVLRSDSSVWCWGFDFKPFPFSAPGAGVSVIETAKPEPIAGAVDVVELRAGDHHTCGKKSDGTLVCWGHNERGQLGDGTKNSTLAPVAVGGLTEVTQFSAGRLHTCALGKFQGVAGLWCWGRNGEKGNGGSTANPNLGRLGNGSTTDSLTPVAVDLTQVTAGGATVKAVSAGGYHTCVVASNNKVWCWGRNNQGQLGNGTLVDTKAPVEVNLSSLTIPNGVTIDDVSCGRDRKKEDSTCLRMSNGTIACWGNGTFGELGDGGVVDHTTPTTTVVASAFGGKPVQLVSGQNARCARTDAGTVFCWGRNQNGLLGAGLTNLGGNFSLPVQAKTIGVIKQISMSHHTACAVDADGAVWCWGTNTRAQAKARLPKNQTDRATIEPFRITF